MVNIFEINRLISSYYKIKNDRNLAKREYVLQKFADEFFIEQTSSFEDVLEILLKLEFISEEQEFLKLTPEGAEFFKLGKDTLNASKKQIIFLENLLGKSTFFYNGFKEHFSNFHVDWSDETPVWRAIRGKSAKKTAISFELFRDMKIFDSDEDGLFIPIEKNYLVSFLDNKQYLKKTDYEAANKKKTEIGEIGEDLTINYEFNRLKNSEELVQRIRQVSLYDDYAGFDIKSFEDDTSNKDEWDRMIEVKATTDSAPHFYFSMNEIKVAIDLKSKYWIYLWTDVLKENPKLRIIQNPYEEIFVKSKEKPEPVSYFIDKNLIENLEQLKFVGA